MLEHTRRTVDRRLIKQKARFGSDSEIPILIVGMPRSGTTLVEQILASHPEISGAGEVGYLNAAAQTLARQSGLAYPLCLDGLTERGVGVLAAGYLEKLEQDRGDARYVTDKRVYNFVHLGLFSILFPEARIIHCVRDPLDTCFSIYCQNFGDQNYFSYNLQDIAEYYRFYRSMMDHWKSVLPLQVFEVPYNELVKHQEMVSRGLLAHCELPWDDSCLRPHETSRDVQTASQWQVRQPVYSSSVAKWQRYKRHLRPLIKALDEYGIIGNKA